MKSSMMKITTKVMAAIMVASAVVNGAVPAVVKADDSVAVEEAYVEPVVVEEAYVEPVVVEEAYVEPVAAPEAYVESAAVEEVYVEPVAVEEAYVEPAAVEEVYVEPAAVEEVYVEPAAVQEAAAEVAVTEMAVADAAEEEIAFVKFVDNGYEEVETDPEVERAVAEVESNMKEAAEENNQDTDVFANVILGSCSGEWLMDAAAEPAKAPQEESEADKKKKKDEDKKETEKQIREAGSIAGKYVVEMTKIDFDDEDAPRQAALLTFKTINETVIPEIPYVGGLISALVGLAYAEDDTVKIQESEETKQLRKTNSLLSETIDTIKAAADKQINANKEQNLRAEFGEMQAIAKELTNEYGTHNPAFVTVMQNLHTMEYPPLEDAEAVFKEIYNVEDNLNDKTYFSAYINFVDKVMNDTPFNSSVSGSDIFATYDEINTIGKDNKEIKYLFNDDRAVLADKVENIAEVGYSTLRYCMEVEFAKQENIKSAYKEMFDAESEKKAELKDQAASLENDFNELQEQYLNATSAERKAIREKMLSDNEQMTSINEEVEVINKKCTEYSKMINKCDMTIARIKSDTTTLNGKKDLADKIISEQRESICEGEDFIENHSNQQKKLQVYAGWVDAVEYELNGKKLLAYPNFKHRDSRIEYKDIFGNVWAHQDVTYTKLENWDNMKKNGTYLFYFNGAASSPERECKHSGEKGVRVLSFDGKKINFVYGNEYPYAYCYTVERSWLADITEYEIGDYKEEFK